MVKTFLMLLVGAAIVAVGCAPAETPSETGSGTSEMSTSSSEQAEMATCDGCGAEVDKASLVSHDGQMMCQACVDAHSHDGEMVACTACGTEMEVASAVMKDGEAYCTACAPK